MKTLAEYAALVNARLAELFPTQNDAPCVIGEVPALLKNSMGYSMSAGGKRLRPSMMLAAVDMLEGNVEDALDFACSVEMIHNYSLIHDDLPGMDDDVLRRGRPTNHVVFGVGQAILAGDGLLNGAFELMLKTALEGKFEATTCLKAIYEIATGAGVAGMIAGQVMDLECEQKICGGESELSFIQYGKTTCMFIHPLRAAAHLCHATDEQIDALTEYARAFGLHFQATDDLLDVIGNVEDVGKTLGKDEAQGKLTMISQYGIEGTREKVKQYEAQALAALESFDERADLFRELIKANTVRIK